MKQPKNLEQKAEDFHKDLPVLCDKKECKDYGEYLKCYWDKFEECGLYLTNERR